MIVDTRRQVMSRDIVMISGRESTSTGWPKKTFPTLRGYFQKVFLGTKVIFYRCIEHTM